MVQKPPGRGYSYSCPTRVLLASYSSPTRVLLAFYSRRDRKNPRKQAEKSMFETRRKFASPKLADLHQAASRAAVLTGRSYGIIPPGFLPQSGPGMMDIAGSGDGRASMAPAPQLNKNAVRRGFLSFAVFLLVMAGSMFLAAGRLDWTPGWAFLGVYLLTAVVVVVYLRRTNPEVLVARSKFHWRDQTAAHKVIFVLLIAFFMLIFPVAGLDDGRWHCSAVPLWLAIAGYVLISIGNAGTTWVLRVNKFAEPSVSIQTERGHHVIDTGPYAVLRHPLYAFAFFLCAGMPLALCSYWAFIPSGLGYLTIVVRTAMEDRLLHNDLPGYREYAARVRYRLIPGVW